jgi:hypothetical protein
LSFIDLRRVAATSESQSTRTFLHFSSITHLPLKPAAQNSDLTELAICIRQTSASMNPRAPHYKFQSSTSSASNGRDLDSIYGSLRNTFVAASTPTMSSTRETPTPSTSNSTGEPTSHSRSLVKYKPQSSDVSFCYPRILLTFANPCRMITCSSAHVASNKNSTSCRCTPRSFVYRIRLTA